MEHSTQYSFEKKKEENLAHVFSYKVMKALQS